MPNTPLKMNKLRTIIRLYTDRDDPTRQVFTLWYKSLSDKPAEVKFVVQDNFGTIRGYTDKNDPHSPE